MSGQSDGPATRSVHRKAPKAAELGTHRTVRPVLENVRRFSPSGQPLPDSRRATPDGTGGMERRAPSELLLILVFSALGLVSLLAGMIVNEWTGTLLLSGGAFVLASWYDRGSYACTQVSLPFRAPDP